MAILVSVVVIFLFDKIREKKSMLLTEQSGVAFLKSSCDTPVCHSTLVKNHYFTKRNPERLVSYTVADMQ